MLYEKHDKLHFPTEDELLDLLMKLIQSFKQAYIVIDALDECDHDDYNQLFYVIKTIHSGQLSHLHLLVSSRREKDIVICMKECTALEICLSAKLVESDIISYVCAAITKQHKFWKWGPSVQGQIKEALINGANGMFRWVACIIEVLRHCPSERALLETLKCLPADLEVIYDQILARISGPLIPYAKVILTWIVFGMRPLTLEQLAIVVTFDPSNGTFDTGLAFHDPEDIIQVCSSLVMKTEQGTVELAHASVKEYFLGKQSALCDPSTGHVLIAHCCLRYLVQFDWLNEFTDGSNHWLKFTHFPLLRYSANFWPDHYRLSRKGSTLPNLVMTFFDDSMGFSQWVKICDQTKWLDCRHPIAYAGYFGLEDIVKALVMKNGWSNEYCITIEFAAMNGYINVVKFILGMRRDINARTALQLACLRGHTEIVKLLLDDGQQALDGLDSACSSGNTEIVKALLEKGAHINDQQALYGLESACQNGHTKIVKLLLDKGVHVNARQALNGLESACRYGHTEIAMLLLDKGSDVHAQQSLHALYYACYKGDTEIVKLLLDKGVDVNAQKALNGLYSAGKEGHIEIVKLLLDKGADVNAQQALDGLYAACHRGYSVIVRLLLDKGADANAKQALNGLNAA